MMDPYEAQFATFGEGHFLAALDAGTVSSDDENNQYSEDEDEQGDLAYPAAKRFCYPVYWEEREIHNKPLPFTGDSGVKLNLKNPQPIDIFKYFCTQEFIRGILDGTNMNAKIMHATDGSNFGFWRPVSFAEMTIFIGLCLHTGTIKMDNFNDYWSSHKLFDLKIFRNSMSKNRFFRILKALKFGRDSTSSDVGDNKIAMTTWMVDYFNAATELVCYPGRELVIDNCMAVTSNAVLQKDDVNPVFLKTHLLIHSLSEPNGFTHKLIVTEASPSNLSPVISSLMNGKTGKGHALFLDSSYCNVQIVRELIMGKTYCTGILAQNTKTIPEDVIKEKLARGGPTMLRYTEPGICLMKWRGREEVLAISSEFRDQNENQVMPNSRQKPLMIREFRKTTCEIDRKKFIMSTKPMEGSANTEWHQAIGFHILQLMLINAYLLYNCNVKKVPFHEFRLSIIESLLKKGAQVEKSPPKIVPIITDDTLHVPRKFPKRMGQRSLRKRCKICLKDGKRTDSYYHCPYCPSHPALCLDVCFAKYHEALKSAQNNSEQETTENQEPNEEEAQETNEDYVQEINDDEPEEVVDLDDSDL